MVHDWPGSRLKPEKQMVRVPSPLSVLLAKEARHVPPITCASLKGTPASSLSHTLTGSITEPPAGLEMVRMTVMSWPGGMLGGRKDFTIPTSGCVQLTVASA